MIVLTLYDPIPEPTEASAAVCGKAAQRAVALDEKGKPSTTRKVWFLLESAGALTTRQANGA